MSLRPGGRACHGGLCVSACVCVGGREAAPCSGEDGSSGWHREWYLAAVQEGHSPYVLGKLVHIEVNVVIELALLVCYRRHGFVDAGDENFPLLVYQAAWGEWRKVGCLAGQRISNVLNCPDPKSSGTRANGHVVAAGGQKHRVHHAGKSGK